MRHYSTRSSILCTSIFLLILVVGARAFSASNLSGMLFKTEREKKTYAQFLARQFPQFFSPSQFHVDPIANIPEEQDFLRWFLDPKVQKVIQSETIPRSEMKRIDVRVMTQQMQSGLVISDKSLIALVSEFQALLAPNTEPSFFFQTLRSHLKDVGSVSSHGLLVGLVNCLPPDLKDIAFPLELDEKIAFLKKNLTDKMVETNFRGTGEKTVRSKLAEVLAVLKLENRIVKLILFSYWQNQKKDNESIRSILGPRRQDFNNFVDLLIQEQFTTKEAKKIRDLTLSNIKNLFEGSVVVGNLPVWTLQHSYRIEEVPPPLAIYRGCVNGDCFTKFAFGFAYAPSERTFFVYNDQDKLIFSIYAMAVQVESNKTALLIHEIGSTHTNESIVEQVVRGLYQNLPALGYSDLIIGRKDMHHRRFATHLLSLRYLGASAHLANPSLAVRVSHFDTNSRNLIGAQLQNTIGRTRIVPTGHRASYAQENDLSRYHTQGSFFRADEPIAYRIETSVSSATNFLARYLGGISSCSMIF